MDEVQFTLSIAYAQPEQSSFEDWILDLGDSLGAVMVHPFINVSGTREIQFEFSRELKLMEFKKKVVDYGFLNHIYVNFRA